MRAAPAASERFAGMQAADHWRRALALWPPGVAEVDDQPIRSHEVVAGIAASSTSPVGRVMTEPVNPEWRGPTRPTCTSSPTADLLRDLAGFNSSQFVSGDLVCG